MATLKPVALSGIAGEASASGKIQLGQRKGQAAPCKFDGDESPR
jgi:hypothetical protein